MSDARQLHPEEIRLLSFVDEPPEGWSMRRRTAFIAAAAATSWAVVVLAGYAVYQLI